MKKLLYLVGVCILAVACNPTPNKLSLTATGISTTNDLYVFDAAAESATQALDTIKVTDGQFNLTMDITGEPKLLVITDNQTMMHYLIGEKGNLTLAGDTGVIKGSPMNDRLADLMDAYKKAGKEVQDQMQAILEGAQASGQDLTDEQITTLQGLDKQQGEKIAEAIKSFYEKDKGTILGIFELQLLQRFIPEEEFMALFEQGGETTKNFPPFVKMMEAKAKRELTKVGAKYLDFEGVNPNKLDEKIKLSDIAGKDRYILLDFWASWCGPCRAAMPELKKLNDKYTSKGLDVVGVVVSDKVENHLEAAKALKVTWTQIFDDKNELGQLYGLEGIPTLILLDKDGTILVRTHNKAEIIEKVESLLGK